MTDDRAPIDDDEFVNPFRWLDEEPPEFNGDADDEGIDDDDCGMTADGTCMYAGSEWCDWECGRANQ